MLWEPVLTNYLQNDNLEAADWATFAQLRGDIDVQAPPAPARYGPAARSARSPTQ
jgi:hypothetical protein